MYTITVQLFQMIPNLVLPLQSSSIENFLRFFVNFKYDKIYFRGGMSFLLIGQEIVGACFSLNFCQNELVQF